MHWIESGDFDGCTTRVRVSWSSLHISGVVHGLV